MVLIKPSIKTKHNQKNINLATVPKKMFAIVRFSAI